MKKTPMWCLALVALGCGGSSASPPSGNSGANAAESHLPPQCPQPGGSYLVSSDWIGGDCTDLPKHTEKMVLMKEGAGAGCKMLDQRGTPTNDGCDYEETQSCLYGGGLTVTATLSLRIPSDRVDMRGRSTMQFEDANKRNRCMAHYQVRYVKTGAVR